MHKKQATAKCNGNVIWKTSPLSDSSISIQYLDNKFVSSACVFYWCSWHKPVVSHPFLWGCFFFNLYSPELPCNDLSSPQHTNTNIKGIVLIIWEELWSIIIWGLTRPKQIRYYITKLLKRWPDICPFLMTPATPLLDAMYFYVYCQQSQV